MKSPKTLFTLEIDSFFFCRLNFRRRRHGVEPSWHMDFSHEAVVSVVDQSCHSHVSLSRRNRKPEVGFVFGNGGNSIRTQQSRTACHPQWRWDEHFYLKSSSHQRHVSQISVTQIMCTGLPDLVLKIIGNPASVSIQIALSQYKKPWNNGMLRHLLATLEGE